MTTELLENRRLLSASSAILTDINQTTKASLPVALANWGGETVFAATTADAGRELWTTTGGATGAKLLTDVQPGAANSNPVAACSGY